MKKLLLTAVTAFTILFAQAQCQANFSFTQNGPTTVFTDMSTINAGWSTNSTVTWEWDFGDGTISTQQNPVHSYANNGIYTPCLTVLYFDSVIINTCVSVSCDSLFIGNSLPASWDCNPVTGCYDPGNGNGQYSSATACLIACMSSTPSWDCNPVTGCYDPGNGNGQYTLFSVCDTMCGINVTPSWDCNPTTGCYDPGTGSGQYSSFSSCDTMCGNIVTPSWDCNPNMLGCSDPGTGLGQYTSLSACQTACSVTASWECDQVNGCYDPGTGIGQYSSLSACQSVCSSVSTSPCDSLTIISTGGSMQTLLQISLNSSALPAYIDYWVTTSNDGTLLGEDSLATSHNVYNLNPVSTLPYDTINTCLFYTMNTPSVMTCCVTWIWNGSFWANMGSVTSVGEINLDNNKLIKIVDVLGRETFPKNNEILFYIYEDGTIDKRYIIE